METFKKVVKVILLCIPILFFVSWLVMLLWNAVIPDVFGLGTITFWQACGLHLLCGFMFKSSNIKLDD